MDFSIKDWRNLITGGTPLNAPALEDIEDRLSAYAASLAAGGIELGYAEITADATRAGSWQDVSGLLVNVTVGTRPIEITFSAGSLFNTSANAGVGVGILEDGSMVASLQTFAVDANVAFGGTRIVRRAPSPGAHTYKIQLTQVFTGTATIKATVPGAGNVGPAFISVKEV